MFGGLEGGDVVASGAVSAFGRSRLHPNTFSSTYVIRGNGFDDTKILVISTIGPFVSYLICCFLFFVAWSCAQVLCCLTRTGHLYI